MVERHRRQNHLGIKMICEENDVMRGSYAMMDALGRFYSNTSGGHSYGPSVFEVGVGEAWAQNDFIKERFVAREGEYDWSNTRRLPMAVEGVLEGCPMSSHVVALSGPRGCGKSTIAQHLVEQHGFERLAFSDVLREIAMLAGPERVNDRQYLSDLGQVLRSYDPQFLLKAMQENSIEEQKSSLKISDSLKNWHSVVHKASSPFILI